MAKAKFNFALVTCMILAASLIVLVCINWISKGFDHVDPGSKLRLAKDCWSSGQVSRALSLFWEANLMAFECGLRGDIAQRHIKQMNNFRKSGQPTIALEHCSKAVQMLSFCDDEGSISYMCGSIDLEIYMKLNTSE